MDRPINIMYGNCQKKRTATLQLNNKADLASDIVILTEPFVGKKRKCTFQRPWNVHCKENDSRAAIITSPWADAFELAEYSDRDSIFCLIESNNLKFIIGACYFENGVVDENSWIQKIDGLKNICSNIVILGDTNAHSILWGYQSSDTKGKKWEEFLASVNLEVFTDTYTDTFCNSRNQKSCIDIAFGSPALKSLISARQNKILPLASDHTAWSICIDSTPMDPGISTHLKLKIADWDKVNRVLDIKLKNFLVPEICDRQHIEETINNLVTLITQTLDETILKSSRKPKNRWWNNELTQLENQIILEQDPVIKNELSKELESRIIKAKGEEWKRFTSNCLSVSDAFLKNKLINLEKQDRFLHPIKKSDGTLTSSNIETAELLLKSWFSLDRNSINDNVRGTELELESSMPLAGPFDFPPIAKSEVLEAINSLKPYSAPGIDDIPAIFFQKCSSLIEPHLTSIFNKCLELSFTPDRWKIGKIILIPKGNSNEGTSKDYRPITLLPIIVKILEKIILKRLQQQETIHSWISDKQYGFQPGRSVNHALMNYTSYVSSKLKQKKPVVAIHLDIEGAFNSVYTPILIDRLKKLNCPNYLLNWCHNYMLNRKVQYTSRTFSTEIDVERSTPQGGSLSPFLWNLVIDPVVNVIADKGGNPCVFADDVAILVSENSWDEVARKSNRILEAVYKWASDSALKFNPVKSQYITYSWRKDAGQMPDLYLGSTKLSRSNKIKYLGVILSEKLQWKSHLKFVADKAIRNLFNLSSIVKRTWGLDGKFLRVLYTGAIEPILLHACAIWASAIPKSTLMKPLVRVQRLAMKFITRLNNKAHLQDSLMLAGIVPIECRAKSLALRWWIGALSDADNPCRASLEQMEIHECKPAHFSSIQQLQGWSKLLGIENKNLEPEQSAKRTRLKRPTPDDLIATSEEEMKKLKIDRFDLKYFTDGSKSEDGVGSAFTRWEKGILTESWGTCLHDSMSNFKAELWAINYALEDIKENDMEVAVVSDSQSVLLALKSPSTNSLVEKTRMKLIRLNRSKRVLLGWTKAHVGTKENEAADQLAKDSAKWRPVAPKITIDKMEAINIIKNQSLKEWQVMWDSRIGKWSFCWSEKIKKNMRTKHFNPLESELLNNFFAGSSPFNSKLNLWRLKESAYCDIDADVIETPRHFLFHCSGTRELRKNLTEFIKGKTGKPDLTMHLIWKYDSCLSMLADELKKRFHPDME